MELDCGTCALELLAPHQGAVLCASWRPALTYEARSCGDKVETRWTVGALECRLVRRAGGARDLVRPFSATLSVQQRCDADASAGADAAAAQLGSEQPPGLAQTPRSSPGSPLRGAASPAISPLISPSGSLQAPRGSAPVSPSGQPLGTPRVWSEPQLSPHGLSSPHSRASPHGLERAEADLCVDLRVEEVAVHLDWEDVLCAACWLGMLAPPEDEAVLPPHMLRLPVPRPTPWCESPWWCRLGDGAAEALRPADRAGAPPRASLALTCVGIECVLSCADGPAYRACARALEAQTAPVLAHAAGVQPTGHRVHGTLEAEAWNAWARAWEPLLEPCGVAAALSLWPRQEMLSLHIGSLRGCLKLEQLQLGRRRLLSALERLGAAQDRWRAQGLALWRGSPHEEPPSRPLPIADLCWSEAPAVGPGPSGGSSQKGV